MAEGQSLTAREVVEGVLASEHAEESHEHFSRVASPIERIRGRDTSARRPGGAHARDRRRDPADPSRRPGNRRLPPRRQRQIARARRTASPRRRAHRRAQARSTTSTGISSFTGPASPALPRRLPS
jgi:hypothetical protein